MDLSGLSAFGSAIYPGYVKGEQQQAGLLEEQEQAKQQRLRTQDIMLQNAGQAAAGRTAALLAQLSNAYSVAPPGAPAPQAPGQPSMPTTSTGAPVQPPGGYLNPQQAAGSPAPQAGMAAPPTSPAAPAAPPPPTPPGAIAPPPARPPAAPSAPVLQGQMTTQQLAQAVIKANPGIQNRPDLLFATIQKMQGLLAPDSKQEVTLLKMQNDIEKQQMQLNFKYMSEQDKTAYENQLLQVRQYINSQNLQGRAELQGQKIDAMIGAILMKLQGQKDVATQKSRADLVKEATKVGLQIDPKWDDTQLQHMVAIKTAEANNATLPEDEAKFLGQALLAGDNSTIQLAMGFTKNRAALMSQIVKAAQQIDPNFTGQKAAAAVAQFGGMKAAATMVGRTAGGVAVGAQEIPRLLPLAIAASKKLDLTRFPTINSLKNAEAYYAGQPDKQAAVVQLNQYVQSMRNAYQQIMARGGRQTVFNAKQAQELINGNLPLSTLIAAGQAMIKEGEVVRKSTGAAMGEVTGTPEAPAPTPDNDPLGIR